MGSLADASARERVMTRFDQGLVTDEELRTLMRAELRRRLEWGYKPTHEDQLSHLLHFAKSLKCMPMVEDVHPTNTELYAMPNIAMEKILGKTLKMSGGYYKDKSTSLDDAEEAMLELYCERAQIKDGQSILDLGCGLGPFILHIAKKYRNCLVTGITISPSDKEFIEEKCRLFNLSNVDIIVADITKFETDATFDRIILVQVLEQMKNYQQALKLISKWLKNDGYIFVDHLCHKTFASHNKAISEDDWFAKYIFPKIFPYEAATIPSASLLLYFQDNVKVVDHWLLDGNHYARSSGEWLKKMDENADILKGMIKKTLGSEEAATKWAYYWRSFFMWGFEQFSCDNGQEWMISHILFSK